jgi:septum formation protein
MSRLVLASGSASRRAILEGAGIPFEVVRPTVDEEELKRRAAHLAPAELALHLAQEKALSVAKGAPEDILVIGADQVLEFEGRAFDKPKSRPELARRLSQMAGATHHLRGGLVVARSGGIAERLADSADMVMRLMSEKEIAGYVDAVPDWVMGTVGGYAVEGLGARLFERIEGDYFSVLGLPLLGLLPVLRREGVIAW